MSLNANQDPLVYPSLTERRFSRRSRAPTACGTYDQTDQRPPRRPVITGRAGRSQSVAHLL